MSRLIRIAIGFALFAGGLTFLAYGIAQAIENGNCGTDRAAHLSVPQLPFSSPGDAVRQERQSAREQGEAGRDADQAAHRPILSEFERARWSLVAGAGSSC